MRVVSLLFHDVYVRDPAESGFSSPAADRYKLTTAAFEAELGGLARLRPETPRLGTELLDERPRNGFAVAITVDDGGISYYTHVADRLESLGWRGHCFVSTDCIGQRGFLDARHIRDLDARGHLIGSHSASHPTRFSACPRDTMFHEWARSRQILEGILGHPVTVASLPGGYFSTAVASTAADAGLRLLFTSEPTPRTRRVNDCAVVGRFTIRQGSSSRLAEALMSPLPWARWRAWIAWNAKGLVRPVLGPAYPRVADWMAARQPGRR